MSQQLLLVICIIFVIYKLETPARLGGSEVEVARIGTGRRSQLKCGLVYKLW